MKLSVQIVKRFTELIVSSSSSSTTTVVSRVSAHEHLNITHEFGPHGHLPGIKIPYVCIEAATLTP